ncbi:hypothetical protein BC831DRAFT_470742 [Entophlyctis helioformis]|nr:hypothetical protein BC831DRAFT_470742 [Entophlyctis helioformis]
MDRLDLEDVIKVVCETISKNRRFSELSHLELCDLWKGLSNYLTEQLLLKKSTNVSGIGAFHVKKSKRGASDEYASYSVFFLPSKTWDKVPGFQIERCAPVGTLAAEVLNLSSVAQRTGFSRDHVEAGLKDIVHALFRILKRGSIVNLTFGNLGKLVFQSQDVKFRFSPGFLKNLNDDRPEPSVPHRSALQAVVSSTMSSQTHAMPSPVAKYASLPAAGGVAQSAHGQATSQAASASANQSTGPAGSNANGNGTTSNSVPGAMNANQQQQPVQQPPQQTAATTSAETRSSDEPKSDTPPLSDPAGSALSIPAINAPQPVAAAEGDVHVLGQQLSHAEPAQPGDHAKVEPRVDTQVRVDAPPLRTEESPAETGHQSSTLTAMAELDEAARKLAKLEELIDRTFSMEARNVTTHTHPHSGNRLWTDQKCPICRAKRINHIEDRDLQKRTEQEHDRMLLHLSLDLDKDFIQRKREAEATKLKNAISTAHYNHLKALEKQQSHSKKESLPMGNLFENREVKPDPVMLQAALAAGLKQQLETKRAHSSSERNQRELEDRLSSEKLIKEIKAAELQAHLEKIQRYKQQQEALSEQIRIHQSMKDNSNEPSFENPFARSESLMALYQKEKAKQLYQEQLAIVRQRREYAHRVTEIEKRHSLERLAMSRKELEKDLRSIKQGKVRARRDLETYWSDQMSWKQKLRLELESNC